MKFTWTPPFIVSTGKFVLNHPVPKANEKVKTANVSRISYKTIEPSEETSVKEEKKTKNKLPSPIKNEPIRNLESNLPKKSEESFTSTITPRTEDLKENGSVASLGSQDEDELLRSEKREGISSEAMDEAPRLGISGESYNNNDFKNTPLPKYEKDATSEELIRKAIRGNQFLKANFKEEEKMKAVVDAMYLENKPANSYVIKEGELGFKLYVCAKGSFDVIKGSKKVNTLGPGKVFGELALLYNSKRNATVMATTSSSLWVLDRKVFHQIMMKSGMQRLEDNIRFLKSVPLLSKLDKSVLTKMADLLKVKFYPTDTPIIKQGDEGSLFYIISGGTVVVTVNQPDGTEKKVGTLRKGDYFGERALLNDDKRMATVTATAPGVECLTLDRIPFIELLGELQELQSLVIRKSTRPSEAIIKTSEYNHVNLTDLESVGTLGVGGFGRVELMRYTKEPDVTFALKRLKKVHIVQLQQQTHAFNEKEIMIDCRNPFIARLYKTYKDSKYLYFLMEACLGGDVWTILQKRKFLDEKSSRFMSACVIEAFDYLHSKGIIYRDLKPENLLLDSKGYVKLVDFGFAKKIGPTEKTWTFAGTPEYLAPEIILNRGHDRAIDYWSLGIFIYELMVGRPPFRGIDHMKTYNLILKGIDNHPFPRHVNKTAQLLIKKLCRPIPTERLGYLKEGVAGIKNHKWYQNFEWEALKLQTLKAPIVPIIRNPTDLSNFETYSNDKDIPEDDLSGWDALF